MFQLTDRILVTGAGGGGVGAGVCTAIRQAGGQLVVNDKDEESAATAAERFSVLLPLPGDVSDSVTVEHMFDTIERAGLRLDGVVNNGRHWSAQGTARGHGGGV